MQGIWVQNLVSTYKGFVMSYQILLADDSTTIQRAVAITFDKEDHFSLHTLSNGAQLVAEASNLKPSVVLLDTGLPGEDPFALCEAIKLNPATAGIKVLLLASANSPLDSERANRCSADGHLVKPFETQTLLNRVKELVGAEITPALTSAPRLRRANVTEQAPTPQAIPIATEAPSQAPIVPPAPVEFDAPETPLPLSTEPPISEPSRHSPPPPVPPIESPLPPSTTVTPRSSQPRLMPAPPIVKEAPSTQVQPQSARTEERAPQALIPPLIVPPPLPTSPDLDLPETLKVKKEKPSQADPKEPLVLGADPKETTLDKQEPTDPSLETTQPGVKLPKGIGHAPASSQISSSTSTPSTNPKETLNSSLEPLPSEAVIHQLTKDAIEKIVWEVVPQLAETMIRERIDELIAARPRQE